MTGPLDLEYLIERCNPEKSYPPIPHGAAIVELLTELQARRKLTELAAGQQLLKLTEFIESKRDDAIAEMHAAKNGREESMQHSRAAALAEVLRYAKEIEHGN